MGKELHILGADLGIQHPGLAHIVRQNGRTRAVELAALNLKPDNNTKPWGDVARRCSVLCAHLDQMFEGYKVDIVAIETHTVWTEGGGKGKHKSAWKTIVMIGAVVAWARSRGAVVIMVNPSEPKKQWQATNKDGVRRAICGAVDGLQEKLNAMNNKGWHASDAAAIAYQGIVKSFRAAEKKGLRR